MKFSTKAIHAGQGPDPTTGAIMTPIYQTSTYAQTGLGEHKGYDYSRSGNPTRTALEACIAALENGRYGLAFASGLAAEQGVLNLLSTGDHMVSSDDLYGGTYRLFESIMRRYNIETTYVATSATEDYEKAIRPNTKMLWLETPTNPLLRLADIRLVADIAHRHKILLVVDNTFSSPYFQQPLDLGADIVVHSTTKYINGHSDVIGGIVVMNNEEVYQNIQFYQNAAGAVPGPFDAWLTLRGVKTLAIRMRQHAENADAIARFLSEHPRVEKVYYPGLPSHPDHELAKRQMSGFGGMVSCQIKGSSADIDKIVRRFKVFTFAESLGGIESLVCHPASMTHGAIPRETREAYGLTDTLLRLSVGIEDSEDLLADLDQALA
ncbi:MAG TPA: cystathionine gamma-synthase [Ktedonobacteraceae bacterium]|nr:cystathionine gamma-synthase [Ktedonobacteraceae bacterium]